MASVQMSNQLRDAISRNYKKQLHAAYRQSHNVQPAVDKIVEAMQTNVFKEFVDLSNRIELISKQLTKSITIAKHSMDSIILIFKTDLLLGLEKRWALCAILTDQVVTT